MNTRESATSIPKEIKEALAAYPTPIRKRLEQLRGLILRNAAALDIGDIVETTKWGQPAYLPRQPRTGTTLRLGTKRDDVETFRLYVHCQTSLIQTYKTLFPEIEYEGNRAVIFPVAAPPPADIVGVMVEVALTYHLEAYHLETYHLKAHQIKK